MANAAQQSASRLVDWLIEQPETYDVRDYSNGTTVDFTIGDPDLWPGYSGDGINAVRSSSVSFGGLRPHANGKAQKHMPRTGGGIHLPPTHEERYDDIEAGFEMPDGIVIVNGTFQLGSLLPPPDGVATPHIIITEEVDVEVVIDVLVQALDVYDEMYEGGEHAIKEVPGRG